MKSLKEALKPKSLVDKVLLGSSPIGYVVKKGGELALESTKRQFDAASDFVERAGKSGAKRTECETENHTGVKGDFDAKTQTGTFEAGHYEKTKVSAEFK